jgi:hypothetical protein
MKQLFALCLMVSAVALSACAGDGKSYPAPYAHERTAGSPAQGSAEATFEKKMAK